MAAKRPVILAGGGIVTANASDGLRQLAELLCLPVSSGRSASKGVIPEDHPLALGTCGSFGWPIANEYLMEADCWCAIGWTFSQKYSAVGCSFPIALGAKLAAPDRPVVCIEGDGGLHYNVTELATAVLEKIPVVLVVMNDGHLNANRQIANALFEGKQVWTRLNNPDWVAVARSFGAGGERVEHPDDIAPALRRGLNSGAPYVIDLIVDPDVRCPITGKLWKIRW